MGSASTSRRTGLTGDKGMKAPADLCSTTNIATLSGEQTVDGTTTNSSRVLLVGQTNPVQNGLYDTSTGPWTRCIDADGTDDLVKGTLIRVTGGATQAKAYWAITSSNPFTPDVDPILWAQDITNSATGFATQLLSSIGTTLVGFIAAGAGAVYRTLQSVLTESVRLADYGGIPNDASQGAVNTAALAAALLVNPNVDIGAGTWTFAASTPFPGQTTAGARIRGKGQGVTILQAPNDFFVMTVQTNVGKAQFQDLTVRSVQGSPGKLFWIHTGAAFPKVRFLFVEFGYANYHIYSDDLCVGWAFMACHFGQYYPGGSAATGALIASRYFQGLWAYDEFACYTWYNQVGMIVGNATTPSGNGSSSTCSVYGGVYELNTSSAIILNANGGDIIGWNFNGTHFEANGHTTGDPDIALNAISANAIYNINFMHCGFWTPDSAQTVRVKSTITGGSMTNIGFKGVYAHGANSGAAGAPYLCSNTSAFIIDADCVFQAGGWPTATRTTLLVGQAYNGTKGQNFTAGAYGTSGATVATITPPSGWKLIEFIVQGNEYDGVNNSHVGCLAGYVQASSGNSITKVTDNNHTSGANQGFIAAFSGGNLVITNKAALTKSQSGDVVCKFS